MMLVGRRALPAASSRMRRPLLGLVVVAALLIPFVGNGYQMQFVTQLLMMMALALSWNLISGLTGYVSFGHVVFFGLGAYGAAMLTANAGLAFPIAIAGSALLALILAVLVGVPLLRIRGHYFAIATFAIAEATRELIAALPNVTGGGVGLSVPSPDVPDILARLFGSTIAGQAAFYYYLMFGIAAAALVTTAIVLRRPLGYGLRAIRADEESAAVLGINRTRYKVAAFALSAVFPALAGGVYASWFTYIDAPTVFSVELSVEMIIMVLLGGIGTVWGPVIGAVALQTTGEFIWGQFLEFHSAFFGLVLVLVVLLMPAGLLEVERELRSSRKGSLGWIRANFERYRV